MKPRGKTGAHAGTRSSIDRARCFNVLLVPDSRRPWLFARILVSCCTPGLSAAQVAPEEPPVTRRGTEREQQSAGNEGSAIVNQRTTLNLVGVADTESGESRRNENVFLNPIDNNALKELNLRLGTTATVIEFFRPERNYFAAEFGNSPSTPLHITSSSVQRVHGNIFFRHFN